jgi:hypothetical protein
VLNRQGAVAWLETLRLGAYRRRERERIAGCPHYEMFHEQTRNLQMRQIHIEAQVVEPSVSGIVGDADDSRPRRRSALVR